MVVTIHYRPAWPSSHSRARMLIYAASINSSKLWPTGGESLQRTLEAYALQRGGCTLHCDTPATRHSCLAKTVVEHFYLVVQCMPYYL